MRSQKFSNFNRGMTFIELIVVLGIFAAMSGVILFNFGGFTSNVTLQNLANQIALQIKSAQTDAINGKESSIFIGPCFDNNGTQLPSCRPSYGVYFDASISALPANHKKFVYFADVDNNKDYNTSGACGSGGSIIECKSEIEINTSDVISKICVYNGTTCSSSISPLSITFTRPFPDATFYQGSLVTTAKNVQIEITSAKGLQKHIVVWKTGQIEIKGGPII